MVRCRRRQLGPLVPHPSRMPKVTIIRPPENEIFEAILSLYADELKPFGRILRKRCCERAATAVACGQRELPAMAAASSPPTLDVCPKHLRQVCERSPRLRVEAEEGVEWSALLRDVRARPSSEAFVDIYDLSDPYPDVFWQAMAEYLEGLEEHERVLPGGRYSCAQALMRRNPSYIKGMSLGRVCHVVQLAIAHRKMLGYLNGDAVPYRHSQSRTKEECAAEQQACSAAVEFPLADWDAAKAGLRKLLETAPGNLLSVSNVKRLFRSQFQLELSETLLGHSKLTTLLLDPRFNDVCHVQLHGHGHAVVQVAPQNAEGTEGSPLAIFAKRRGPRTRRRGQSAVPGPARLALQAAGADSDVSSRQSSSASAQRSGSPLVTRNTFIDFAPDSFSRPSAVRHLRRSRSLPAETPSGFERRASEFSPTKRPCDLTDEEGNACGNQEFKFLSDAERDGEKCTSAASTSSTSPLQEHIDSEMYSDAWSDSVDRSQDWSGSQGRRQDSSSSEVSGAGSETILARKKLNSLRCAGHSVIEKVWGSPPQGYGYVDPREAEVQEVTSDQGTQHTVWYGADGASWMATPGGWEFQGYAAVQVWVPLESYGSDSSHSWWAPQSDMNARQLGTGSTEEDEGASQEIGAPKLLPTELQRRFHSFEISYG